MRPDQCHGEPKPTEIIPDTSKYTDTVEKLRALTAVIEAQRAGSVIEWRTRGYPGNWTEAGPVEPDYSNGVLLDYRAKPKPRELWAIQRPDGTFWPDPFNPSLPMIYMAKPDCVHGNTPVRFVEQP